MWLMSEQMPVWAAMHPWGETWWQYHRTNPDVYAEIVRLADDWAARVGPDAVWSMKGIFEVLRWQTAVGGNSDGYRLNNAHTSLYTRLLLQEHPEFEAMFEVRRSPGEPRLEVVS